jgi:hypothetical protein
MGVPGTYLMPFWIGHTFRFDALSGDRRDSDRARPRAHAVPLKDSFGSMVDRTVMLCGTWPARKPAGRSTRHEHRNASNTGQRASSRMTGARISG